MEKYEEITKELTQQELNLVEPLKRCSDGKAFQIEGTNTQRTMKILQLLQFIYALGKTGEKLEK
jgi:hypothetical protein